MDSSLGQWKLLARIDTQEMQMETLLAVQMLRVIVGRCRHGPWKVPRHAIFLMQQFISF